MGAEAKLDPVGDEIIDDQDVRRSGEWVSDSSSDGGRSTLESCFGGMLDRGEVASEVGDSCSIIERWL